MHSRDDIKKKKGMRYHLLLGVIASDLSKGLLKGDGNRVPEVLLPEEQ